MPSAVYDGNWKLELTNFTNFNSEDKGVFIGNGKIGMITNLQEPEIQTMMITTDLKYANGLYKANITEPFYLDTVKFFDNANPSTNIVRTMTKQTLDMYSAMFTNNYTVTNNALSQTIQVESDIYTPNQLPFNVINTLRITPDQDMSELFFFHEVYAKNNITNIDYNNNVIYNQSIQANGLYILNGKGTLGTEDTIAFASIYVIEPTNYQNLGFNVFRDAYNGRAYNKFVLQNLVAGTTYRIHIISTTITSFDFVSPLEECKRICLNIVNKTNPALQVRTDHITNWQQLWLTDISILPKTGITVSEANNLTVVKRSLRYSLFKIFSSVRENINIEVNPMNLSVIDYDGNVLYNGDLWLIPLLTLIKPDIARALLEYRHKALDIAKQLAAGYGYNGAKFPYMNDSIGYKNALYWDTTGPMTFFNTALIAINIWNYYRVVKNKNWLVNKGYVVLAEIADFFASIAEQELDGSWHINNVISLNGTVSQKDNSFTNNMARLALKYAIEASYELNYPIKDEWYTVYYGLQILILPDPDFPVVKYDNEATSSITLNIVEPWFILIPYYSQLYFNSNNYIITVQNSILKNIDYYNPKINIEYINHPFNKGLLTILYALYSQYDSTKVPNFCGTIMSSVTNVNNGVWGTNDIGLTAILLFSILQGAMQLQIKGGVAETRFYYEEMRITNAFSANLPETWKSISTTIGKTFTTTNKIFYTGGQPCI